jgi:hypothetical protein
MRKLTSKIFDVLDGYSIPEKNLMLAIEVTSLIQGIRYRYGPEEQYGEFADDEDPEIKAIISGRIFPSMDDMQYLIDLFDEYCDRGDYPVPRTDEINAYYEYVSGFRTRYENPMYEKFLRDEIRKEQVQLRKQRQRSRKIKALINKTTGVTSPRKDS